MQQCFARYPTVYNKSGDNDDDDLAILDSVNQIEPESNVDTVDQLEDNEKPSTTPAEPTDIAPKQ